MALTIVDTSRLATGGVDTHLDLNVAAALDGHRRLVGAREVPDYHRRQQGAAGVVEQFRGGGQGGRRGNRFVWSSPGR